MVTLGNPARDVEIKRLVIAIIAGNNLFQQPAPFVVRMRILKANSVKAVLQAEQMFRPTKRLAGIHRNDFVHAIAKNETSVQYRNSRFLDRHEMYR